MIVQLTEPVFTALGHGFSWRDMILIPSGLLLVSKGTKKIHYNVGPDHGPDMFKGNAAVLGSAPPSRRSCSWISWSPSTASSRP